MIRGLYTATSGMVVESAKLDTISDNLYRGQIPGFKAANVLRAAKRPTAGPLSTDIQTVEARRFLDYRQGDLRQTGEPLDLALDGPGFFAVQTPGGIAYTRDGRFKRGTDGGIVDGIGNALMGEDGPMRLPEDTPYEAELLVEKNGEVSVAGKSIGTLMIRDFPKYRGLRAAGGSLFFPAGNPEPAAIEPEVLQRTLESSNTSVVGEMSRMISTTRAFESYQKVIQSLDETIGLAVSRVGRVA